MSKFIDFALLKERVSIEQVAHMLNLKLKDGNGQLRGACPACKQGGDRALVITPAKAAYYCFGDNKGGDMIALASHILGVSVRDAASQIAERYLTGTSKSASTRLQVPESESGEETKKLQPLAYLQHDHEAVIAVGFDPDKAQALGIGYAPKGMMRGTVAVPIRDEHGTLVGYIGITEARLPTDFTNVVPFKKTA